jgi:hypothetical protein
MDPHQNIYLAEAYVKPGTENVDPSLASASSGAHVIAPDINIVLATLEALIGTV